MSAQPAITFTFHKVRQQCEQGNADAWRAFVERASASDPLLPAARARMGVQARP